MESSQDPDVRLFWLRMSQNNAFKIFEYGQGRFRRRPFHGGRRDPIDQIESPQGYHF